MNDVGGVTRGSRVWLILTSVWWVGCSVAEQPAGATVSDSAGVRIVTADVLPVASPELALSGEPVLEIGAVEGAPEYQFTQVVGIARLMDGWAVLDADANAVRQFDRSGEYLRTVGRGGQGPGELSRPLQVFALPEDSILVWDAGRPGYSVFSPDGAPVAAQRVALDDAETPGEARIMSGGRYLVLVSYPSPMSVLQEGEGLHRVPVTLRVMDRQERTVETIGVFPGIETVVLSVRGQPLVASAAFPRTLQFGVLDERLVVGTTETLEVRVLAADGALEEIFRAPSGELAFTEADREWYGTHRRQSARSEAERAMVDEFLTTMTFPDQLPAFSSMLVSDSGDIWLRTGRHVPPSGIGPTWSVMGADGAFRGEITMPPGFDPLLISSGEVAGVWRDQTDVPFVRVYRLTGAVS